MPVSPEDAVATAKLLPVHADPFDRLLIAQARSGGLTLLTADALLAEYGTQVRCLAARPK
jgi:PIN domain nuclease of toxin-antitoxin system